ncbi:MAG: ROK family protein, partial [Actinomycetota bacterium]
MTRHTAAIDLGGTHVRVALVDPEGNLRHRTRAETARHDDRPDQLVDLVQALTAEAGPGHQCTGVVIGIPGIIDHDTEALVRAPNLNQAWIPHLRADWFEQRLGLPVALANDADLAAVGEAFFGAGRHHRDVVYVTISTGVGAGAVFDGSLVRGRRSGSEIGHTIVDLDAARSGQPATVEELGAGPAIAKAAAAAGLVERDGALADLVRSGHQAACQLWERAIDAVAVGITNVAWLLAPDVVVVGGGVGANNPELILPRIASWLERHGPAVAEPIAVAPVELGDDAALDR